MSKFVTINLAQGLDKSVDPRIAPNGTLTRVQNLRVDQQGRMALRNGYQSLGVTVHDGGTQLVPFDLHEFNGDLVCLGNNSPANQTGIRAPYVYTPYAPKGNWRTASASLPPAANNTASLVSMPPADAPRILYSDSHANAGSARAVCDIAAQGNFICVVSDQIDFGTGASFVHVEIIDATTSNLVYEELRETTAGTGNARVIAVGTVFLVFYQVTTSTVQVTTFDTASSTAFAAITAVGATTAVLDPYDVAPVENISTEYLIVRATATGYTWERRLVSTHAIQASANVVSLANAAVSICGANGETVNVVNVRTTNGYELRTFTLAGALTLGPTNLDIIPTTFNWVGIARLSSSSVYVIGQESTATGGIFARICATSGAHAPAQQTSISGSRTSTKPIIVDGIPFIWAVLGLDTTRPYGLMAMAIDGANQGINLSALALNGLAKTDFSGNPSVHHVQHIARGSGKKIYAALLAKDSRDSTFRVNVFETEVFSGARRQAVTLGQTLYIAGGTLTQFDGVLATECGFDVAPFQASAATQLTGGAMTLLGVYQFVFVFRCVARSGEVTQSAPTAPFTITMTGVNNRISFIIGGPFGRRMALLAHNWLTSVVVDVYRTEAGGSIPRLSQSVLVTQGLVFLGQGVTFTESNADSVVQSGAKLYTQGESGSISGRLPLALASPCRNVAETAGKLWLGGLERRTEYQLSIESRPGEALGFANDDLFFGSANEDITALAVATDGKRLLMSRTQVRTVQGEGPNAAGIGELSEPLPVDSPVGCNDWRSVVACEHGVLFRASDDKIYLLPKGNGAALIASDGIRDLLEQFPVTTGAVRHEADQLVTFTIQNSAGTDGRVVHLDLQTSGFDPKSGWRATWIVDRCALFEDVPEITVLSDTLQTFGGLQTSLSVTLPAYNQSGDRFIVLVGGSGSASAQTYTPSAGWNGTFQAVSSGCLGVFDRILTGVAVTLTITAGQASASLVRVLHLRGAHPSQAVERVFAGANSATSLDLGALTPSWGSAKNLWIAACCAATTFTSPTQSPANQIITGYPSGFGNLRDDVLTGAGLLGNELATCRQSLTAASLDPTAFASANTDLAGTMIAIRPAAAPGTPIRAPEQFGGRIVVCNSTDVFLNTLGSFADQGSLFIAPEVETATIYGMGPGGAARHKGIVFVGEFRARCVLGCELSYDDGLSYTELTPFTLNAAGGYTAGQTVRIQWVPKRRKVEGVRARFRVTEDAGTGPSEGLVFNQAIFEFEELVGASRLPSASRR